jgi:hypothetical protein
MSFMRHSKWVIMTSPGGKLTSQACNLTKKVNKAKELTNLSTNIEVHALNLSALLSIGTLELELGSAS